MNNNSRLDAPKLANPFQNLELPLEATATDMIALVDRLLEIERDDGLIAFLHACRWSLEAYRQVMDVSTWERFADSGSASRLRERFFEDPYSWRGYKKPRGYAGDAVLLDYVYGMAPLPDDVTRRGSKIYQWMCKESRAFHAVRDRRARLAAHIDSAVERRPDARVLSLACGHLREFAVCTFDRRRWTGELVALDQDPASLAVVKNSFHSERIAPTRCSISELLQGEFEAGDFDLIYAAGLFDYLDDTNAIALLRWCAHSLRPGGNLLVANFSQCEERGFMEAVMQWQLIYRSEEELSKIVANALGEVTSSFTDEHGIISYSHVEAN